MTFTVTNIFVLEKKHVSLDIRIILKMRKFHLKLVFCIVPSEITGKWK